MDHIPTSASVAETPYDKATRLAMEIMELHVKHIVAGKNADELRIAALDAEKHLQDGIPSCELGGFLEHLSVLKAKSKAAAEQEASLRSVLKTLEKELMAIAKQKVTLVYEHNGKTYKRTIYPE